MNKIQNFPELIPDAIVTLFSMTSESCSLHHYSTITPQNSHIPSQLSERLTPVANSIFIKGPKLHDELAQEASEANTPFSLYTTKSYKNTVTSHLLNMQSQGSNCEWSLDNFRLCVTKPTRKSPRLDQTSITPPQNSNYNSPMKF